MTQPTQPMPMPPCPVGPRLTPATLGLDGDLIGHALHALSAWCDDHAPDRAARLLSGWARVDELTDRQWAEVLAYYPGEPALRGRAA